MNQKVNLNQKTTRISELKRPNPPTPEMIARAQPYRADTLQKLDAVIKDPSYTLIDG